MKDKGKVWGGKAYEKSWKWSDAIGGRVNDYAGKVSLGKHGIWNLISPYRSHYVAGKREVLAGDW